MDDLLSQQPTMSAAFAAADTLLAVHGTFNVLEFVEFHLISSIGRPSPYVGFGLG